MKQADAGIYYTPEDPDAIADAARQLAGMSIEKLDQWGENRRNFYFEQLSIEAGTKRFVEVLGRAISP